MSLRHIVLVAPPWYPVPPPGYGGIELVVGLLAGELRSRGHRVTVLAAEGSPDAVICAPALWGKALGSSEERLRELTYAARAGRHLSALRDADLVHDHVGFATLLVAATQNTAPVVHTVHGEVIEPVATYLSELPTVAMVALSESQRRTAPGAMRWVGVVPNAVDIANLRVAAREDKEPYLLCLARICAEKGQHTAIEVARRVGMRLVLAGKVEGTTAGRQYFHDKVAPAIDGDRVVHVSNTSGRAKTQLLARAAALLAPIQWEEPFGLSVVEAMVSGTAAISMARGAAPELIDDGVSGFVVADEDAMVEAVGRAGEIDPQRCAEAARRRFSPAAMTDGYLDIYEEVLAGGRATRVGAGSLSATWASAAPGVAVVEPAQA